MSLTFFLFGVFVHPVSLLLIYFSLASFIISLRLLLKISVNLRSTQKKPSHYHATYPNHSHSKLGCSGLLLSSLLTPALFIMYYCNRNILCRVKRKIHEIQNSIALMSYYLFELNTPSYLPNYLMSHPIGLVNDLNLCLLFLRVFKWFLSLGVRDRDRDRL